MEIPTPTKRRNGPIPKGFVQTSIQITPDLQQWALRQPEGLSGLVRQLLTEEMERRTRKAKAAQR
jgi:hypothetical protein